MRVGAHDGARPNTTTPIGKPRRRSNKPRTGRERGTPHPRARREPARRSRWAPKRAPELGFLPKRPGVERERERERDVSAALTHLHTAPTGRTSIPITSVPVGLMQKLPLFMRSGPSPFTSPAKRLIPIPGGSTQTQTYHLPGNPRWETDA